MNKPILSAYIIIFGFIISFFFAGIIYIIQEYELENGVTILSKYRINAYGSKTFNPVLKKHYRVIIPYSHCFTIDSSYGPVRVIVPIEDFSKYNVGDIYKCNANYGCIRAVGSI